MLSRYFLPVLGLLCAGLTSAHAAAPAAPPPPKLYDVEIRYRIRAFRNQRLPQYAEMMRAFKKAGFERDPDEEVPEGEPENPNAPPIRGTVPGDRVQDLLAERHVQSLLLVPHDQKLPADKARRVRVDLQLSSGLEPDRQRLLAAQTREALAALKFEEGVGYDNRGFTRLLGSVPAGQVPLLLKDLRDTEAGAKLPNPFRSVIPIRATTALPEMALPVPRPKPPAIPKGQEKLAQDLRDVLAGGGVAGVATRLEVILANTPGPDDRTWARALEATPGVVVEGRLGPLVTVFGRPDRVALPLAELPGVDAVRLARVAQRPHWAPGKPPDIQPLLDKSGLTRLHAIGRKGRGTRVAVVESDFRGWQTLLGKGLPEDTRMVDLTRERNRDLQPDPFPKDGQPLGPGVQCALTLMKAAPQAELTLIRVDPAAAYMVQAVARSINGELYHSHSLDQRAADLENTRRELAERQDRLLEERRRVMENFGQDEEDVKQREQYRKSQAQFERDDKAYQERLGRYLQFQKDVRGLRGIRIVASGLVWNEGYPVDGSSPLSRYFDDRPFRAALWFQAAGDVRGQAWSGLFRDADHNGIMEFAPPGRPLPPGAWTGELDFLSWRTPGGKEVKDLPANTRLRVSVQWREPHDPLPLRTGEDPYRVPLTFLRLVVLHQPDPAGAKQPADDLEVVAESVGVPERLEQTLNAASYEQTVEVVLKKAGRYALRVEGVMPESTKAPGEASLPSRRTVGEIRPRIFVETLAGQGRATLHDFVTARGTLGMPADAHQVITVGAADAGGKPEPYSTEGPPHNLALLAKPDVLTYDQGRGTASAACFAAGVAAVVRPGLPRADYLPAFQARPGGLLRVPPNWPRR